MTIREMQKILDAQFLYGEELEDVDAEFVFSADMMSDVLAYCGKCSVLMTGLCNPQVVRTAEMLDIVCIIFVRGKMPDEHMLALAMEKGIAILATEHGMRPALRTRTQRRCLDGRSADIHLRHRRQRLYPRR